MRTAIVAIFFPLAISMSPDMALANAVFYTNWNCENGYTLDMDQDVGADSISSFKDYKFSYPCTKEVRLGSSDHDFTKEIETTCEKSFNDAVFSVDLDEGEYVTLYEHTDYKGSIEIAGPGPDCFNLGPLHGEVSSAVKGRPTQQNW